MYEVFEAAMKKPAFRAILDAVMTQVRANPNKCVVYDNGYSRHNYRAAYRFRHNGDLRRISVSHAAFYCEFGEQASFDTHYHTCGTKGCVNPHHMKRRDAPVSTFRGSITVVDAPNPPVS